MFLSVRNRIHQHIPMPKTRPFPLALLLLCASCVCAGSASHAAAQGFETVGTRAQGMGGAFVAVADDATATYWNPAGMASIPIFDLTLGFGRMEQEESRTGPLRAVSAGRAPAAQGSGWRCPCSA